MEWTTPKTEHHTWFCRILGAPLCESYRESRRVHSLSRA